MLKPRPLNNPATARETKLFEAVDQALADVPVARRAGIILLTDGQVHDVPSRLESVKDYGPVHTLLTGRKNERDRQLILTEAPAYGIVGQEVTVRYRIEDPSAQNDEYSTVSIKQDNTPEKMDVVPINEDRTLQVKVNRIHLDVTVPHDVAEQRVAAALAAGGTLVNGERARAFWVLADPEGNEACVCTWQGRD